jgi:hypothetical protein
VILQRVVHAVSHARTVAGSGAAVLGCDVCWPVVAGGASAAGRVLPCSMSHSGRRAMETHQAQFEYLSRALIRCFVLSLALLFIWFVFYLLVRQWAYDIHSRMFELTRREFDLIMYCGMAFVKLSAFFFFLIPYISVRLILRGR